MPTVLVTGGSGFLGAHCIVGLLESGQTVRTTVRDLKREPEVREAVGAQTDTSNLSFAVAELGSDDGWAEAVAGADYVLHVASPFPPAQPKDPDELIVPARDGALRVIKAALDADVKRIVLTSSVAAVRHGRDWTHGAEPYTEADWTNGSDTRWTPYVRSKTIAEQAAWEHVRAAGAEDRLAVVNPGAIIGPVLSEDRSYSIQAVERLLGGLPAVPRLGFTFVDVRDVADLHIRAMTSESAGGERFIAADRFLWMQEVSQILRDRLGEAARRAPTRIAPNVMMRVMAVFDPAVRSVISDLREAARLSSAKARETLGWSPRPVADSIADTGRSLIDHGIVKG